MPSKVSGSWSVEWERVYAFVANGNRYRGRWYCLLALGTRAELEVGQFQASI